MVENEGQTPKKKISTGTDHADLALIAAINQGESAAFERLYFRYRDWAYGLAYRFTANHADAQDVLQETFAYLARKFPGFELTATMKTFLYPAIRNYSIAQRKKRAKAVDEQALDEIVGAAQQPAQNLAELQSLIQTLPAAQQQVLLMRFADEMTVPEIATALDIPAGTVKSRLHHAVRSLRESPVTRRYFEK
ncbi:MAG: sigma-70 family RNA polymerase sigma factor [Planctomycetota bacterium]